MKSPIFIGNPSSIHIDTWQKIYKLSEIKIKETLTVHPCKNKHETRIHLFSKIFSYILLGIYIRLFRNKSNSIIHAHGGSGYGLSALISGLPYIVTIYGSEVLQPHNSLYNLMMRLVLRNAKIVTVTSEETSTQIIKKGLMETPQKILLFHTGIDFSLINEILSKARTSRSKKTILSIRNSSPQYRTEEIVNSFCLAFPEEQQEFELKVILGNGSMSYIQHLKNKTSRMDITYIPRKLSKEEIIREMCQSYALINFPETDQLSATLLEAVYCGKPTISSDLKSYSQLKKITKNSPTINFVSSANEMTEKIKEISKKNTYQENTRENKLVSEKIASEFSIESASKKFTPAFLEAATSD